MVKVEGLEKSVRTHFKEKGAIAFEPILKGGSARSFYRALNTEGKSLAIVVLYSQKKYENAIYVEIAQFLKNLNVPVPAVYFHDAQKRIIFMEDLGALHLQDIKGKEEKKEAYQKVLQAIWRLHHFGFERLQSSPIKLMEGFTSKLYEWERYYFYENFLGKTADIPLEEAERLEKELTLNASSLLELSPALVHRDLQSHNILFSGSKPYFIDFQGMRIGTFFYDLASLLYDPYVNFEREEREGLLNFYFGLEKRQQTREEFQKNFEAAAVQRLMQALGAYGFLGLVKGNKEFLKHVPSAIKNLREVVRGSKNLELTKETIDHLDKGISFNNIPTG